MHFHLEEGVPKDDLIGSIELKGIKNDSSVLPACPHLPEGAVSVPLGPPTLPLKEPAEIDNKSPLTPSPSSEGNTHLIAVSFPLQIGVQTLQSPFNTIPSGPKAAL